MIDTGNHQLAGLFAQLGLDNHPDAISRFITDHPLGRQLALPDAPCWNDSQAAFLRQALANDAEWSDAVDTLAALMQNPR